MPGSAPTRQLPLEFGFSDAARLETFVAGANAEALQSLRELAGGRGAGAAYLWGEAATGKTHLLRALCVGATPGTAACLPMRELSRVHPPSVLDGMEALALLCVDDVDALAGLDEWERALFSLYNRAVDSGCRLLMSGRHAPATLPIRLRDLRSRILGRLVFQLRALDDDGKAEALRRRAAWRGLDLPPEVADYLLHRCSRSLPDLLVMLETLDVESLASGRRLTVPFVKQALDL